MRFSRRPERRYHISERSLGLFAGLGAAGCYLIGIAFGMGLQKSHPLLEAWQPLFYGLGIAFLIGGCVQRWRITGRPGGNPVDEL